MKSLRKILLVASLTSAMAAATALSQPFPNALWSFNEQGLGLFNGGTTIGYSLGTNRVDPVSGMSTLWYSVGGPPVLAGDVVLIEPQTSQISDLIRFDGQGGLYFFSDLEPGELNPDPADVPQLPAPINPVVLNEVGPEGNNGAFYLPGPGMPGFDPTGVLPGLQYQFISDVPEPSSMALLITGAGLLALKLVRSKRHS